MMEKSMMTVAFSSICRSISAQTAANSPENGGGELRAPCREEKDFMINDSARESFESLVNASRCANSGRLLPAAGFLAPAYKKRRRR